MIPLLIALAAANAPNHDALDSADWNEVGTRSSDAGDVLLRRASVEGVTCIEGTLTVATPVDALLAVTDRMVTSPNWSDAALTASEELDRDDTGFVLYQHFNSPGWTLSADRFWVVRGEPAVVDASTSRYRWHRVPASDWPSAQQTSEGLSSRAVEMPTNYGEWRFTDTTAGTEVLYRACADIGGRAPGGLVTWLTTQQVPDLVAELIVEAGRS